jgi:hypothetical protein
LFVVAIALANGFLDVSDILATGLVGIPFLREVVEDLLR